MVVAETEAVAGKDKEVSEEVDASDPSSSSSSSSSSLKSPNHFSASSYSSSSAKRFKRRNNGLSSNAVQRLRVSDAIVTLLQLPLVLFLFMLNV